MVVKVVADYWKNCLNCSSYHLLRPLVSQILGFKTEERCFVVNQILGVNISMQQFHIQWQI